MPIDMVHHHEFYRQTGNLAEAVIACIRELVINQNEDGGWGEFPGRESDIFPTYIAIWAFCESGLFSLPALKVAIGKFESTKLSDGTWGSRFGPNTSIDATIRALLSLVRYREGVGASSLLTSSDRSAIKILLRAQNKDGSWSRDASREFPGSPNAQVYAQGDVGATLPMVDLLGRISADLEDQQGENAKKKAVDWLESLALATGGCGYTAQQTPDTLPTAWALRALLEAGSDSSADAVDNYIQFLLARQRKHGGWCQPKKRKGDTLRTYNAVHSLSLAGKSIANSAMRRGCLWLLNNRTAVQKSTQYIGSLALVFSRVLKADFRSHAFLQLIRPLVKEALLEPFSGDILTLSKRFNLRISRQLIVLSPAIFLALLFFVYPVATQIWQGFSQKVQEILLYGVGLAIVANIFAALIYERLLTKRR